MEHVSTTAHQNGAYVIAYVVLTLLVLIVLMSRKIKWYVTETYLHYTVFFLLEYLFLFEPQVFLAFLKFQPQNILKIFLLEASAQLIFLTLT